MDKNRISKKSKERQIRAVAMFSVLKGLYGKGNQNISLNYKNPLQLLVAVILSAQCTDKRVNEVTKELFKKYKKIDDYANAKLPDFEKDIKSTGFYKNKAKNILELIKIVVKKHNGKVPKTMEDLVSLPGVGRKTANVVLSHAFGIVVGVVVDTHIKRFSYRFDLSDYLDAAKIENDLMQELPKKDWTKFSDYLIKYGREICPAKIHDCSNHPLTKIYPTASHRWLIKGVGYIK